MGVSICSSWQIIENFKNSKYNFFDVVLLKNNKKILSTGMNIGIKAGKGNF